VQAKYYSKLLPSARQNLLGMAAGIGMSTSEARKGKAQSALELNTSSCSCSSSNIYGSNNTLTGENQTNGEQQQYAAGKTKSTLVYWKSFARLTTTAKVIKCKKQKKNK